MKKMKWASAALTGILAVLSLTTILPFLWMLASSFKTNRRSAR
jgi:ABC-type glycerol-3-phosphate transport system permease component